MVAGIGKATAHPAAVAGSPTKLSVIRSISPDLYQRALQRRPVSWAWLRHAQAHRWDAEHPAGRAAARRRMLRAAEKSREDGLVARHHQQFTCIAEHESHGTWDINTGNGYYGGLQMDRGFQQTYAPHLYARKGTADNWTEREQRIAAARAVESGRGYHPWPNTARMCGLI